MGLHRHPHMVPALRARAIEPSVPFGDGDELLGAPAELEGGIAFDGPRRGAAVERRIGFAWPNEARLAHAEEQHRSEPSHLLLSEVMAFLATSASGPFGRIARYFW